MRLVELDEATLQEARTFNAAVEELLAAGPSVHTVAPEQTRLARAEGRGSFPPPIVVDEGRDETIPGPDGNDIGLRVFVPPGELRGVYLHLHGGGWVLGSASQQDVGLWRMANEASVAVVSVDYRLAPEHPFPAGPDDCEAAARWLVGEAASRFGAEAASKLVIGGESAGGHLAALTLLRLRDRYGLADRFVAANLVFGAFDLTMTPSQRRWGDRNLVLSTPIMAWFYDCFLPGMSSEERRSGDVSPLYADLSSLPPALFSVGLLDPLLDDSLFMAARWAAAGNEAELLVYPEAIHGFNAFPIGVATAANEAQWRFVEKAVAS
ncbi:MAG TPA: alpha/beta hydrolase fold domain-containing protein [Acidimicrobiales bacterium]|nr:alpha/beta hydrolase fold domain-containing protein [Acidimicrobiales bacterium]